ncbi:MAG: hypothetical protein NT133_16105 [Alphaproteobacteria bacterium]|nr:hypothetical protein [Alphaproteobacteria bacterium]
MAHGGTAEEPAGPQGEASGSFLRKEPFLLLGDGGYLLIETTLLSDPSAIVGATATIAFTSVSISGGFTNFAAAVRAA